jgi:AcrR family transcriptional regulator
MKKVQHDTVRRILDAATEVFAEVGISGARVAEIARRADVNVAAIYYHIGGKEELYTEVLRDYLSGVAEQAIKDIGEESSPEEKLKLYIRNVAQLPERNPHIVPIIMREMASGGKNLSPEVTEIFLGLVETLTDILAEGEQQQVFVPTVPVVLDLMITGTLVLFKNSMTFMKQFPEVHEKFQGDTINATQEVERLILRAVKQ